MVHLLIQLYWEFLKIGIFSFGGGYVMLPFIEASIVQKGWITTAEFINIVAIAEMTPGTIALNCATYIGYNIAGIPGSLTATAAVLTPPVIIVLVLGNLLFRLRENRNSDAVLKGLRPAFIALISMAGFFIAEHALIDIRTSLIFVAIIAAYFSIKKSPLLLIFAGAILGLIFYPY